MMLVVMVMVAMAMVMKVFGGDDDNDYNNVFSSVFHGCLSKSK